MGIVEEYYGIGAECKGRESVGSSCELNIYGGDRKRNAVWSKG
jgi:hypothetical protein